MRSATTCTNCASRAPATVPIPSERGNMRLHRLQVWFAFMMMLPSLGCAQSSLHTASAPQGGKISYGKIDGQANEAGAMGVLLRNLHTQHCVRPQVGRLFQVRNTNSVATFFSLPAGGKN